MKKRINSYYQERFKKALLQMAIWSFVASFIWTLMGIYSALNKEVGIEVNKEILNPISIKFDVDTLKRLETRQALPQNFKLIFEVQEATSSGQN